MKILNLYAGIGGNRKLWGEEHQVTAVEFDAKIAAIYKELFPNDTVVVADAHQYLLDHYKEFDFIWGSPPCQTHSQTNSFLNAQGVIRYPDMSLYQEILFLKQYSKKAWCIENVTPYYTPLISPQQIGRHCFWTNFKLNKSISFKTGSIEKMNGVRTKIEDRFMSKYFDVSKYIGVDKDQILNNCVAPEIGKMILDQAVKAIQPKLFN